MIVTIGMVCIRIIYKYGRVCINPDPHTQIFCLMFFISVYNWADFVAKIVEIVVKLAGLADQFGEEKKTDPFANFISFILNMYLGICSRKGNE